MAILTGENIPAPDAIHELVQRFDYNLASYKSAQYNEAQLRLEFLNPFFEALGWDVHNKKGYAENYKEVIYEDAIKVGEQTKAPDYGFRIGGVRKFFVEAKKPSVNIKMDVSPAYQLRRYAWSGKLPLSILTDFEEFAVYDCRIKPSKTDKASTGRVLLLDYKDYAERWSEIAGVFAREQILRGSFDKYVESKKAKRGTAEVDDVFLDSMENWRLLLARNLAIRNPDISHRELNYAVQQTIDRIIFLRMCEDRGIEDYGRLRAATNGEGIYGRLKELFYQADFKYNSGLFYFENEKGRGEPDNLTPGLTIDDKVLKEIITNLYYPDSPYVFSQIPAEILGQVYEQFLGKVIYVSPGRRVKVEEKPEVRKAGGVYYTPDYIVNYIVKQTVGRLVGPARQAGPADASGSPPKSRPAGGTYTPRQMKNLRILDPACGSGSFLVAAYQFLLDKHLEWYQSEGREARGEGRGHKAVFQGKGGDWFLTTDEKKSILTKCIYGVDIDPQAVEVTKLSLLLKVLEGENQERLENYLRLFHERALPDLSDNIKCGNSLIGSDFYDNQEMGLFDEETRYRINVFDWEQAFPDVFNTKSRDRKGAEAAPLADARGSSTGAGGFDAVIGNPPYVRSITLKECYPVEWEHYRNKYKTASFREWDIYLVFVEKGLSLLNSNGRLGYILPNKFLNSKVGENLRSILAQGSHLERLVHFGAFQIFPGATTYTCLLFLDRKGSKTVEIARYNGPVNASNASCPLPEHGGHIWNFSHVSAKTLSSANWEFTASNGKLLEKIRQWPSMENIAKVFQGTGTRADKVYLVEDRGTDKGFVRIYSAENEAEFLLEPAFLKRAVRGRSIGRYKISGPKLLVIVPYELVNGKYELVPENKLAEIAPKTLAYLRECKPRLDEREKGRFKGPRWYCFGRPQNMERFEVSSKLIMPDVAKRGTLFLDHQENWLLDTAYAIVPKPEAQVDLRFLLAILNSPLLTHFLKETGTALRGGYFRMKTAYLNPFPIPELNWSNSDEKAQHDRMVSLVYQMLALHQQLAAAKLPDDTRRLQQQIDATDRQIDRLVYELYGLTPEEIQIVQESVGK